MKIAYLITIIIAQSIPTPHYNQPTSSMKHNLPFILLLLALAAIAGDGPLTYWTLAYAGAGFLLAMLLAILALILLVAQGD